MNSALAVTDGASLSFFLVTLAWSALFLANGAAVAFLAVRAWKSGPRATL